MGRLKIKERIILLILLPSIALSYFIFLEFKDSFSFLKESDYIVQVLKRGAKYSLLIHSLQKERGLSAGYITSKENTIHESLKSQRKETDEILEEISIIQVSELRTIRKRVDALKITTLEIIDLYSRLIDLVINEFDELPRKITIHELEDRLYMHSDLIKTKENLGRIRATITAYIISKDPSLLPRLITNIALFKEYRERFLRFGDDSLKRFYNETYKGLDVERVEDIINIFLRPKAVLDITPELWWTTVTRVIDKLKEVEDYSIQGTIKEADINISLYKRKFVVLSIIFIVVFSFSSLLILNIISSIRKSVSTTVDVAEAIGRGNISGEIPLYLKDEMGDILHGMKRMQDNLKELISWIKKATEDVSISKELLLSKSQTCEEVTGHLTSSSSEITTSATEIASTSKEIKESIENLSHSTEITLSTILEFRSAVEEIVNMASSLSSFVDESSTSIEESFSGLKTIRQGIEETNARIEATVTALQEITKSITMVKDSSDSSVRVAREVASMIKDKGVVSFNELRKSMDEIKKEQEALGAFVDKLVKISGDVVKIIRIIDDIADETKLLSLNAAILSAQAGEHGKGFGVVAENIKSLAERTGVNTKEIASMLETLKKEVSGLKEGQERTISSINNGMEAVKIVGGVFKEIFEKQELSISEQERIKTATEEQVIALEEISKAAEVISSSSERITKAVAEQDSGNLAILKGLENVKDIAKNLKRSTEELTTGADSITKAEEDIHEHVSFISRSIMELERAIELVRARLEELSLVSHENLKIAKSLRENAISLDSTILSLQNGIKRFKTKEVN